MNILRTTLCACALALLSLTAMAKDYQAVAFGAKSDGITLNTRSIQQAIDYISAQGGGRLIFYVGRYLTGSIELKSNVTLVVQEGAVLIASPSVYDQKGAPRRALVYANGQQNIAITGKGILDGNAQALMADQAAQTQRGYLAAADAAKVPTLIAFTDCAGVQVSGLMLQHAAYTPQVYTRCADLSVSDVIFVPSPQATQTAETDQCSRVAMTNNLTYPY